MATTTITQRTFTQLKPVQKAAAAAPSSSTPPASLSERLRLRINDRWYDLTQWKNIHPGGKDILEHLNGQDATDAFYSLHSPEAIARLSRLPSTAVTAGVDAPVLAELQAFRDFRAKLMREGWFDRSLAWDVFYFAHIFVMAAVGTYLYLRGYSTAMAVVLIGVAMQQAGWIGHDFVHGRGGFSFVAGRIAGSLLNGFSSTWWSNKHNTHHCYTNHVGIDADIANEPVFHLFFPSSASHDVSFRRYQHLYFVPVASWLFVSWRIQSIQYAWRTRNYVELAMISVNYVWLYACFPAWLSLAMILLAGGLVAVIVTASHQSEEMYEANEMKAYTGTYNFVRCQFETTRDATTSNAVTEYLWGGMQYQLEHHLFPIMPKYYYSRLARRVREFAERNNLPYKAEGEWALLRRNYETLKYYAQPFETAKAE